MKKLLLILTLAFTFSCSNSTPDASDIQQTARAAILNATKNPAAAKFHNNEVFTDLGDGFYSYTETVNATNSFGGSVAQNVFVKVKWIGEDPSEVSSYQLIDLQFAER